MDNTRTKDAVFIALAIEKNLEEISHGLRESTFVDHVSNFNPLLNDAANIEDVGLNAAWNYADQYFFSYEHGDKKMCGLEWNGAFRLLLEVVTKLKTEETITDLDVLAFQHPL